MKSINQVLKSFENWLFRHSHYVVPPTGEGDIASKPIVNSHEQYNDDDDDVDDVDDDDGDDRLQPDTINMRSSHVELLKSPERCYFILPSGGTVPGWELSKSKMTACDIVNFFELLVRPLEGKFTNDAELVPTVSDITILDPLRTVAPDNRISRCINYCSTEHKFYEISHCHLHQGIILNPFAIILGYGIVAYASCKNENHDNWAKSNIGVNPVIIPFSALRVMYGPPWQNPYGAQRHSYQTNPFTKSETKNTPTDVIQKSQGIRRTVGW